MSVEATQSPHVAESGASPQEQLNPIVDDKEQLQEKCGIYVRFTPYPSNHSEQSKTGAIGVRHRGQHGWGFAIQTPDGVEVFYGNGLIQSDTPIPEVAEGLLGYSEAFQCRYGTDGDYGEYNLQPTIAEVPKPPPEIMPQVIITSKAKPDKAAVVHNGQFSDNIRQQLEQEYPEEVSDTFLFTKLLEQKLKKEFEKGGEDDNFAKFEHVLLNLLKGENKVNGAYSLIVTYLNKVYVARDEQGIRPLVLGKENGALIATSETNALDQTGATPIREVKPGEVVRIDERGINTIARGKDGRANFCTLEGTYFMKPNSRLANIGRPEDRETPEKWDMRADIRKQYGIELAREFPIPNVTRVVGIPDTGIDGGQGYAFEAQRRYVQSIINNDPDGVRVFQQDTQRTKGVKLSDGQLGFIMNIRMLNNSKLGLVDIPDFWKDQVIVLVDDSLIRGGTSPGIIEKGWELGAREIHLLVTHPPIEYPCHLATSIREQDELIYYRHGGNLKTIAQEIKATSVGYLNPLGWITAEVGKENVIIPEDPRDLFLANGFCGGCITGRYPIDKYGKVYELPNLTRQPVLL